MIYYLDGELYVYERYLRLTLEQIPAMKYYELYVYECVTYVLGFTL